MNLQQICALFVLLLDNIDESVAGNVSGQERDGNVQSRRKYSAKNRNDGINADCNDNTSEPQRVIYGPNHPKVLEVYQWARIMYDNAWNDAGQCVDHFAFQRQVDLKQYMQILKDIDNEHAGEIYEQVWNKYQDYRNSNRDTRDKSV